MKTLFKSSINTKFDLGKAEIFNGYIPTNSHVLPLQEILSSSFNYSNKKSHLIIGPYGTGKSYLTTLICSLLSKQYDTKNINKLIKKFSDIGEYNEVASLVSSLDSLKYQYIPVLMNGNEGSFREAIIANLYSSINSFDSTIVLPGLPSTIREIINRWKLHYPDAYKKFLSSVNKSEKDFLIEIDNFHNDSLNKFKEIYSEITFGEELIIKSATTNFIQTIEDVLSILSNKNLGIIIAYDEFGRFLQTISQDEIYETMQDLQDLAELANSGSKNFELILVSHKNLNSYFQNYNDELKNEFNRIEGRFSSYTIKSDQNVFASIIKNILDSSTLKPEIESDYISTCEDALRIYNLFEDLTPKAITELVIKGCYPIHPVTLSLLSSLSNIFGQNERTLFTFSDSSNKGGLKWFLSNSNAVMYPSYLYEYFFDQEDNDAFNNFKITIIKNNIELIKGLALDPSYLNVYIFICLWELVGLNEKQKITLDFISFSYDIKKEDLELILEKLISLKIIRYNYRLSRYETTEGSSLDMEAYIREVEDNATFENYHITNILSSLLSSKYKKIISYNESKQMTRFASLSIDLLYNLKNLHIENTELSDFYIHYFIIDNKNINREDLLSTLAKTCSKDTLFCITNIDIKLIEKMCKRIRAIDILLNNEAFLSKDSNAQLELQYLKDETLFNTEKQIGQITNFSHKNIWIYQNRQISIVNDIHLQSFLSNAMEDLYPKTPIISNDLYNKRHITGAQKKAGIKVVQNILDKKPCSGSGPDYLLYYSVFINNNYDYLSTDNPDSKLADLQNDLIKKLKNSKSLKEIINFFESPEFGYGIRKPLIPILFTGLLSQVWENLLFFNKDSFLMDLDPENIFEMFYNPEGITFKYHSYTDKQLEIMNTLIDIFGIRQEDYSKPKHIKAGNAIYYWMKSLPRYAQITFNIDKDIINFRDTINYLSIDPIHSLNKLYSNFSDKITKYKLFLDNYINHQSIEIVNKLYSQLSVTTYEELKAKVMNCNQLVKLTNPLVYSILNSSESTLIEDISQKIIGISIESWSDNTVEVFNREITNYCNQINNDEYDLNGAEVIEINGEKKLIKQIDEFSIQAINLEKRIDAMINAQHSRVTKDEITNILYTLLQKLLD
ncbi:hypothetical protein QUV96_10225 [Amedibacillus dolichus]|uniref:AAA+ ATPase domain-containing protein n=1 Tax=Amedibacillus dolichus TaxID=31971 RepID=A0ABT7UEG1_9FIRM|nr:hypothetical protein [Amedibacillus dolichus]MDM8158006.1 hypothetical protein [Amedibacillus dolichus]